MGHGERNGLRKLKTVAYGVVSSTKKAKPGKKTEIEDEVDQDFVESCLMLADLARFESYVSKVGAETVLQNFEDKKARAKVIGAVMKDTMGDVHKNFSEVK